MEIRELRDDEREAAFYVGSQAFANGNRDMSRIDHPDRRPRTTFGLWDESGLQAMASIIPFQTHFGRDITIPMGGVAGVACLPASRGKGYAGDCLKHALRHMREERLVVSTLFPFSFDFYDRLGWAWTGVTRTYEVPSRILKAASETDNVRAAVEADRPGICSAYTEFARRYRGAVVRDDKLWNGVLNSTDKQHRYSYVFEHDGRVEGYLTYIGGSRQETRLRELVALTPRAQRGLLGLLRRHDMQIEKFFWEAPSDDLLWSALYHWDLKTKLEPTTMGRIVDVAGALRAWKPDPGVEGSLILAVRDKLAPWNEGAWRVAFENGAVAIEKTSGKPQVSLDIRALSQAYFGTPTVPKLRAAEQLQVDNESGYTALRDLLAGPPMWMNDNF